MFTCDVASIDLTPLPLLSNDTATDNSLLSEQNTTDKALLGIPEWLAQINEDISRALERGANIRQLVEARACAIDSLLIALFKWFELDKTDLALFATGGYGRGELSLYSDIDILLLSPDEIGADASGKIDKLVALLWDIGLEPALSVRSVNDALEAALDHTIASAQLEARLLIGNEALRDMPIQIVNKQWSPRAFFDVKMEESKARYLQHNATEYNLEPNIKTAPGGLRDIHIIGWVTKRYFRVGKLYDLVQQNFLTEKEFDELSFAEGYLWQIRHYLHVLTGRNENKLLFDYQREIAQLMGYETQPDDQPNAAVERFMRDYYRCAMQISTLSEMLTNHYYETIIEPSLPDDERPKKQPINARFNRVGDHIAIAHHRVFAQHPESILEMFLLMGQHGIDKVRTHTLRALKIAARGIDQTYRDNPVHKALFLSNLKEQNYLFHRLRTMNRYGVLGNYIPAFAQVTGLMQYDLFHRYTVDAHTLFLIRILHRFTDPMFSEEFPLVSTIFQRIERKEILVLAAMFHDIAKGRGGDHSELGQTESIEFCLSHGMSLADANLVGWLTRYHLLMSITAQKKDISDPEVVTVFADLIGNVTHLNHLYVLTVADMNATNPQLWNSWRATLMKQLYSQTRRILRADIDAPTNRQDMISATRAQALAMLDNVNNQHMNRDEVLRLWDDLGDEYFLREIAEDILWHTEAILNHPPIGLASNADSPPLVVLREHRELALDAVQVFVYTQDQMNLFAVTMAVFDQMNLDVLDARIITATRDFALDSYVLLDPSGTLLVDEDSQQELKQRLINAFKDPTVLKLTNKRMPRQLRHFEVATVINFEFNEASDQHIMSLETLDQPGLLARVGQIFLQEQIEVHAARITTLGERAEDMFYISDQNDKPLSAERLDALKSALLASLATKRENNVVYSY
ncbi:[protein-PII] uridylyltransferase [Psychrobacter pacificensis]|uniref:Bifunctional uridylyltransferase/uridylyl-removing enzyme n=2 Tax=Psychrobacter TaxID=497 RepID=A0A1G6X4P9_9GAMM|nr:[protein-PII] uridylyltransferase [Psychrobacter pacificensis]GLR30154.1 bifunctional uridylyltransferase/uridylyl-removing enzyme [Psychrobacter pacificensis]SDD72295.1 UTP--GlnB (protein PII) uridylyltransferase, GlnD [Psychrobacter pacificensis]